MSPKSASHRIAHDLTPWDRYRVEPGKPVHLDRLSTDAADCCDGKQHARTLLKKYRKQIGELVRILAAEHKRSLLVVLQGVDASGKDGSIRNVFTGIDPQFCRVTAFKPPDREEQLHDYLWRTYRALPAYGEVGVFNRSHYEDAIVLRARGEMSRREVNMRLRQIADVERSWSENNIVLCKFLLHISHAEQTRRFQTRLDTPSKHWKAEPSDFSDRKRWPHFISAYNHALAHTAAPHAPWYILPSDHKWYRDVSIAAIVLGTLQRIHPRYPVSKIDKKQFKL